MNKYKNISNQDLEIPGVGVVKAGEIIESESQINNSNLEKVAGKNNQSKSETNKDEESI